VFLSNVAVLLGFCFKGAAEHAQPRLYTIRKEVPQMNSKMARMCFYGNLKRIGGREADPEKYNLYFGLAKLAEAVSDVDRRVQSLRQEVKDLRSANRMRDSE
jgi:hypothetical protein